MAVWKQVAQPLMPVPIKQCTGRHEEDGCWPTRNAVAAPHHRPKVWTTDIAASAVRDLENTRDDEPLGGPPTWILLPSWNDLKVILVFRIRKEDY